MLNYRNLHDYQKRAVAHILSMWRSMLMLDMGLGKTPTVLTAIAHWFNYGVTRGVLVIAPLRVCQTVWEQEARKWQHTKWLSFGLIHGSPGERRRIVRGHYNVYLVNFEALPWLVEELNIAYLHQGKELPFDTLVIDEITKLKSTIAAEIEGGSVRGEALQKILPHFPRRIGLTGTPAPNGLSDLFGQYLLLDDGYRLGRDKLAFQERFFVPQGYRWILTDLGKQQIHKLIADITLEMKAGDYLDLPPVIENIVEVELTPKLRKQYEDMELAMFLELDSGATVESVNAAVLLNRCLQFSNGAIYHNPETKEWEKIHDLKLDALEEIFDSHGQEPLLVAYQFKHDKDRIMSRFKKHDIVLLDGSVSARDAKVIVSKWNQGKIPILLGNAGSIGHGMNLQFGSNQIAWFGLSHNLDNYLQLNARIARQGQQGSRVMIHKILTRDTVDFAVRAALSAKEGEQSDLRQSLNEYRNEKRM